jgi:hypothetical protein
MRRVVAGRRVVSARPEALAREEHPMVKVAIAHVRYALAALTSVGFGVNLN